MMEQKETTFNVLLRYRGEKEYKNAQRTGTEKWKKLQEAAGAIIPILEKCFHDMIKRDIELEPGYNLHCANQQIDKMLICIDRVCTITSNSPLKFKPFDKFKKCGSILVRS